MFRKLAIVLVDIPLSLGQSVPVLCADLPSAGVCALVGQLPALLPSSPQSHLSLLSELLSSLGLLWPLLPVLLFSSLWPQ